MIHPTFQVRRLSAAVVFATLACLSVACSSPPATQPHIEAATTTQPAPTPFVIDEAQLPAGFPPPGAVDRIVVKEYPAYRLARITKESIRAAGQPETQSMFMALVQHLQRNHIDMTAPAEASYDTPSASPGATTNPDTNKKIRPIAMAVIYPNTTTGQSGIDPQDPRINVLDVPASTVISIGIRGGYSAANFTAALTKLNAALAESTGRFTVVGPPRYFVYNSPFIPDFARFGEVQLPVVQSAQVAGTPLNSQ